MFKVSSYKSFQITSRRKLTVGLALVFVLSLFLLSACAQENDVVEDPTAALPEVSISGFADQKADLDFETGNAVTPISDYLVNADFDTLVLFSHANQTVVERCMADAGEEYSSGVSWGTLRPQEDRLFGKWDRAAAAEFGFDFDPSRGIPKRTTVNQGVEFNQAINKCYEQAAGDKALEPLASELTQLTLSDRIQGNAAEFARKSEKGKEAASRLKICLEKGSFVQDPESGSISSEYSELGKEAEIAAAVAEATCNAATGRTKDLYDLKAQYEAAYIEKYKPQLNEVLDRKQEVHRILQHIIDGEE